MTWLLVYVLVLTSPILILVLLNTLEQQRSARRRPLTPEPVGVPRPQPDLSRSRVALEAQFLVAPRLAIEEAELRLGSLRPSGARAGPLVEGDLRQRFEELLLQIESLERAASPGPGR